MTTTISHAGRINELHGELANMARTSLETAIELGRLLSEQKSQLNHGEWLPWCRDNLVFSAETAQRYMRVNRESKNVTMTDLGLTDAYRLLSQPTHDEDDEAEPEADEPAPTVVDETKPAPTPAPLVDAEVIPPDSDEDDELEPQSESEIPEPMSYRSSQALEIATVAIAQLERIHRRDTERKQAFRKVIAYCEKRMK